MAQTVPGGLRVPAPSATNTTFDVPVERLFPPAKPDPIEESQAVPADTTPGLFVETDDGFETKPMAQGPFDSIHGGAIGVMLASRAEALAAVEGLGTPIGAHIQFLRPLRAGRVTAFAEVAQPGRRLTLVDAFIEVDGGLRAEGRFTFARDVEIAGLPPLPSTPVHNPAGYPETAPVFNPGQPWLKDAQEWRAGPEGIIWIRSRFPFGDPDHVMPRVLTVADWATGVARPDGWHAPKASAFPNPALTVQLWRRPVGEWIGMTPVSRWNPAGFGMSEARLYDVCGDIGTSCQPTILIPLG